MRSRPTKRTSRIGRRTRHPNRIGSCGLQRMFFTIAVTCLLAACNAPIGVAPNLQGTYWEHALVTNPNGGGEQVVRWGPPDARPMGRD